MTECSATSPSACCTRCPWFGLWSRWSFLLIHLVPGDPILQMLGEGAPATDVQAARHAYGLDVPLGQQYLHYWRGVLHGDLGPSLRFNQGVASLIGSVIPTRSS